MSKKIVHPSTPRPWRKYADTRYGPSGSVWYHDWIIDSPTRKLMAVLSAPALARGVKHSAEVKREHSETLREVEANAELIVRAVNEHDALRAVVKAVQGLLDLAKDPAGSTFTLKEVFGTRNLGSNEIEGRQLLEALKALEQLKNNR
jgi:hypothetical protein